IAIGLQRGSWSPGVAADAAGGTIDRARYGGMPAPAADITHTQVDGRLHWGEPVLRWGQAHHLVRAGLTLRRSTASSRVVALPTVAEAVAGLPARVWVPISPTAESHRALHEVGVFIGDRVAFGPSLTVDLGVRADIARGAAEGNETGIRWNTLAPRAAFRWRHSALAVFGGAGRYTGGHPLS